MNYLGLGLLILVCALLMWYSEKQRRKPFKKVKRQRTFRVIEGGKKL
jgi:hypothetical protein